MRLIDADRLKEKVLKWLPSDPCGIEGKEHPIETDIVVSLMMEIEEAPTANDWIPASELPKDAKPVLVYACNVHHVVGQYKNMMTHDGKWEDMWVTASAYDAPHRIKNVIAWKPLTIPDKESDKA